MTGDHFLDSCRTPRNQALPGNEPTHEQQQAQHREDHRRGPVEVAVDGERSRLPFRERPELGGDEEQQAGVAPEEKTSAEAAHGGTETNAPPPAPGEEIDRSDRERQERRQEHELDRPAPHESCSEVHIARRSLRKLEAGVERADEVLGRPAELAQARGVERVVLEDLRRSIRNGRERHRRDAARDERPLLSEGERKAEVEQLAEAGRTLRLATGLLEHPNRRGSHKCSGR